MKLLTPLFVIAFAAIRTATVQAQTVTLETVAEHAYPTDCWTVVHGVAYDVTAFAPNHKGGEPLVQMTCGTDATTLYDQNHKTNFLALGLPGVVRQGTIGSDNPVPAPVPATTPKPVSVPAPAVTTRRPTSAPVLRKPTSAPVLRKPTSAPVVMVSSPVVMVSSTNAAPTIYVDSESEDEEDEDEHDDLFY